ncbi:hypothetical protein GCM10007147_04410 [Nocardiopsis kunsanensis]|uniref:Uncharacterized protein n=1 Tax=Nocardiopsis kunsanensis TaxID=141693 RepID=A0A918X748_9ACTN|nr:hypothetical protein GCM10007147_04410 [Nocardiopsis kunsanensis]
MSGVDHTVAQAELLEQVDGLGTAGEDGLGAGVDAGPCHGRSLEFPSGALRCLDHGDGGSVAAEAVRGRES